MAQWHQKLWNSDIQSQFSMSKAVQISLKKAAQTAQTEEFMLQNVAYRPTVYRTGVVTS